MGWLLLLTVKPIYRAVVYRIGTIIKPIYRAVVYGMVTIEQ